MKCTNCGNDNPATLWDEGDTIYCSVCTHRMRKTDFEDDSVQCPCSSWIHISNFAESAIRHSIPKEEFIKKSLCLRL